MGPGYEIEEYGSAEYGKAQPLVALVGPTGSGKSELALRLSEQFGGEVINCDSLQVYRYLDIGTAKLPFGERRGIPHHLIDILNPDEPFTAGEYARQARPVLREVSARGRLPVVTGGTGFYLRALLDGLFPGPSRDQDLRARLAARERRHPGALAKLLRRIDPEAARRIHPHDLPKIARSLEIRLFSKKPATEAFARGREVLKGYKTLKIGLFPDRQPLYGRLDVRCAAMFEQGLMEEVRSILGRGYPETVKPLESHGYKQALQVIRGELSPRDALFYAQRNTRHYAKRQMTWFRQEEELELVRGFGNDPEVQAAVFAKVRNFLALLVNL
jgi:tRNA dimethylallyltransferase